MWMFCENNCGQMCRPADVDLTSVMMKMTMMRIKNCKAAGEKSTTDEFSLPRVFL